VVAICSSVLVRTQDDRELREWAGDFDPEEFDPRSVNKMLQG